MRYATPGSIPQTFQLNSFILSSTNTGVRRMSVVIGSTSGCDAAHSTCFVCRLNTKKLRIEPANSVALKQDARCTRDIKCCVAMAKAAMDKKKALITSKLDLHLSRKL
jgi:hypothetical protein